MHGTSAGAPVPLSGLGGLVTLADSESVPEGASPRTYDTDYLVQKVKTRAGLAGVYSFAGGEISKLPTAAADISIDGAEWTNPAGVEGSSSYASVAFGPANQTKPPASVVNQGAGIPWVDPQNAATGGIGSNQTAVITGFSITGNVVSFIVAPMSAPLVAGQPVTISGLMTGTYLNSQVLTVLSSGLSSTTFQADFTHANVAMTYDAGFATPSTAFTYAINNQDYTPPGGQESVYAALLGPDSGLESAGGSCFGSTFAGFSYVAWLTGVAGVNGCSIGGVPVSCISSGFAIPTLPPGAVVQAIIPVAKGTQSTSGSFAAVDFTCGATVFTLDGTLQQAPSLGTDLSILATTTFGMTARDTANFSSGTAVPWDANIEFFGVAVVYTGSAVPPTQLQTLAATNFGFAVESGAVSGVQVNFNAGMVAGSAASLVVRLTLNGNPIGTPKFISIGSWATSYTLGSSGDLWGLGSLTAAQINGASGLGVNISGSLPDGSQINLNDLSITVNAPGATFSDFLDATAYGFSLTTPITGLQGSMTAYGSGTITAQLLLAGIPTGILRTFTLPGGATALPFGGPIDTWGLGGFTDAELNNVQFGLRLQAFAPSGMTTGSANVQNVALDAWVAPNAANFEWIDTFVDQDADVKNLLLDSAGNFYVEDVTNNPTVLTLIMEGITPGSRVVATQGPGVEYMAFTNGVTGSDMPLQYTTDWIDRITQVGPGAAPIFTPVQASSDTFAITNITQPAAATDPYGNPFYGGIYFLQSSGPGSTAPGNVITIYYGDSTNTPVNADLATAWAAFLAGGAPVLLYLSVTGTPTTFGPLVVSVTGIGEASPLKQPRPFYYLTFNVSSSAYTFYAGSGHTGYEVAWQRTLATMNMAVPVPGLQVGNQVTISGNSESGYNTNWPISQTLNSATMAITATSVTSGVATFNYAVQGIGSPPAVGELVTITGTTNANGALNLLNASIATATGGPTGSFTIDVSITQNFSSVPEDGQATTAGSIFTFDPGLPLLNTSTNPIYGTGTGGTLIFAGSSGQFLATGTKQGTVFFITRNGYYTAPAPPVTFTIPENCTSLVVSNLPLGPPNVVARGIALTESGQNGTPGANFFTIPTPVSYVVNDQSYTANALIVQDNIAISGTFFFTDSVLLTALAIDIYGYNLFNQIEIGDPGWIANYAGRNFYGLCRNKIQNFVNLSFDGGYNPSTKPVPLGWSNPDAFGSLIVSPKFGNAYYIQNNGLTIGIIDTQMTSGTATYTYTGGNPSAGDPVTVTGTTNGSGVFNVTGATIASVNTSAQTFTVTGLSGTFGLQVETGSATVTGTLPTAGLISQSAFQDAYLEPILNVNTAYSVRVSVSNPSGNTGGNLVISLTSGGLVYGSFTLPFSEMSTSLQYFTGTILVNQLTIVPTTLLLNVEATDLASGADVLIDRLDLYPTEIPVLYTTIYGSYAGLPEQVDGVTGQGIFSSENQQPVNGAIVMYDTFYALKGWTGNAPGSSMYTWQASANLEPAQWQEPEVAQRLGGTCGPLAFDLGEQWFVGATRAGAYLFTGGQPGKINQEIYQVWNAINWAAANSIWTLNDEVNRRLMFGVPMNTPNFWLPNAPTVTNPTSPNVILVCNYQGLDSGEEMKNSPQMHTTMFGTLNAIDMRRKWSIWQISSPYAAIVQDAARADQNIFICNGIASSQVYRLDDNTVNDHGQPIDSLYTTAGFVELSKRSQVQGLGSFRLRWGYLVAALQSLGNVMVRLLPNRLDFPEPEGYADWTLPGGFSPGKPAANDVEAPLNFAATRTYLEFRENDGEGFELSNVVLHGKKDVWNTLRGAK